MYHNPQYDLDFNSIDNSKTVDFWAWKYEAFRKRMNNAASYAMEYTVLVPLFFFLALLVKRKRKKFTTHMKTSTKLNSVKDYKRLRNNLDNARFFYPVLNKVKKLEPKELPWSFRYFGVQMKKMSSTLLQYFAWLEKEIEPLNTEQFKSQSKTFKFTSEKELWENRNKAYDYWM